MAWKAFKLGCLKMALYAEGAQTTKMSTYVMDRWGYCPIFTGKVMTPFIEIAFSVNLTSRELILLSRHSPIWTKTSNIGHWLSFHHQSECGIYHSFRYLKYNYHIIMREPYPLVILHGEGDQFFSLPLCRSFFTIKVYVMATLVVVFTVLDGGSSSWGLAWGCCWAGCGNLRRFSCSLRWMNQSRVPCLMSSLISSWSWIHSMSWPSC